MHVIYGSILISSLILTASAIECYQCESVYEPGCGFDFDSEEYFKIDCDQVAPPRYLENDLSYINATACMKKIYKDQTVTKYVRSCYFGNVNETDIGCRMDPTMMGIQDERCFVCYDENYCNTAAFSSQRHWWSTIGSLLMLVITAKILNLQCL